MTDDYKPCPHCGSTDLLDGSWYLDDEEVDAIECNACKAGAPASVWNERAVKWRYPDRGDPMPVDKQRILMTCPLDAGVASMTGLALYIAA